MRLACITGAPPILSARMPSGTCTGKWHCAEDCKSICSSSYISHTQARQGHAAAYHLSFCTMTCMA
jgi:hypothetical protein